MSGFLSSLFNSSLLNLLSRALAGEANDKNLNQPIDPSRTPGLADHAIPLRREIDQYLGLRFWSEDLKASDLIWPSEKIEKYCKLITNQFHSNGLFCTLSADSKVNRLPSPCKNRLIEGDKESVVSNLHFTTGDYLELIKDYINFNRLERAAQAACYTIHSNRKNPVFYGNLGLILYLRLSPSNIEQLAPIAIETSQIEVKSDPENPHAHARLANLLKKMADLLIDRNNIVDLTFRDALYFQAIQGYQNAITYSLSPKEQAIFYRSAAESWLEREEILESLGKAENEVSQAFENAYTDFQSSLENQPSPEVNYKIAEMLRRKLEMALFNRDENAPLSSEDKEKWGAAATHYNAAMTGNPAEYKNWENIYNLATAHKYSEDFTGARKWFHELIKLDPENPEIYIELGEVEEKLKDRKSAHETYAKAFRRIRKVDDTNYPLLQMARQGLLRTANSSPILIARRM